MNLSMKKPPEHPAPNTPQKWLHLSEEAANSFRNDWKEHFILLGFQQWEHDSRWEDLITYVCWLFRYLERIGDYLFKIMPYMKNGLENTKQNRFKKMFLSSLKKFDIFFHPPRQSPPNWMYPLGQHRPGAVTDKCTPPPKKKGQEDWCMCVCILYV